MVGGAAAAGGATATAETTTVAVGVGYRVAPVLVRVAVENGQVVDTVEEIIETAMKMKMTK